MFGNVRSKGGLQRGFAMFKDEEVKRKTKLSLQRITSTRAG
jgi:hypothetical protein